MTGEGKIDNNNGVSYLELHISKSYNPSPSNIIAIPLKPRLKVDCLEHMTLEMKSEVMPKRVLASIIQQTTLYIIFHFSKSLFC